MNRCVVNVATTERYRRGQSRLELAVQRQELSGYHFRRTLEPTWPTHQQKPYAFKAYALMEAAALGYDCLLWCDACILPVASMEALWQRIERDGYWIARNGYMNDEWTADSALPDLFPEITSIELMRAWNAEIPHVVATAFGINLKNEIGREFLSRYHYLASATRAFCGPWDGGKGVQHRHDQTAASVIAWRLGFKLTDPPEIFSYPPASPETILLADGAYE